MLRNLASSLFLTERDAEDEKNAPKVKGRIVTTLQKAKEVRPLVEKCITIARRSLLQEQDAEQWASDAERGSEEWRQWRKSEQWRQWSEAVAPAVAARRRALRLLGDKQAVRILFDEIAPRFADRGGGYTRILRLASPRVGDAGVRAIIEFVGVHDRVIERSQRPVYDDDEVDQAAEKPAPPADELSPAESAAGEGVEASQLDDQSPAQEPSSGEEVRPDEKNGLS
jgi:large subunit ribosomal protein L17